VAAHPDDEVLGCGATIARFARDGFPVHVVLLADGETSRGVAASARVAGRKDAAERAGRAVGCSSVEVHELPDNRLDTVPLLDIVKLVEVAVSRVRPSIVLTHHGGDTNIDHVIVHNAVNAACRPLPEQTIGELLFFEVPSSTEWRPAHSGTPFVPNYFVDVTTTLNVKLEALRIYQDELRPFPHPRSIDAVEALAKWRGATAGVGAAEAFIIGRRIR
jgi:LmbE family N-acetylglucosaminyl deacetylase